MRSVYEQIDKVHSDALSFDAIVPLKEARKNLQDRVLMGNVSTFALEFGDEERVQKLTKFVCKAVLISFLQHVDWGQSHLLQIFRRF